MSATSVRAWRRYHAKPWKWETFKLSTDPEPAANGSVRKHTASARCDGALQRHLNR